MGHRNVSPGRGAGWIVDGVDLLKRNPGVLLGMGFVFGLLASLPVLGLFVSLVAAVLYGGYVSALHTQAGGGQARLSQLFDGFSRPGAFARLLAIVALTIAVAILIGVLLALAIGTELVGLMEAAATGQEPDPQATLALLGPLFKQMLWVIPIGLLLSWTVFFAVPRAMLDEVPGLQAIGDGFRAIWSNLPALLVNLLCWIVLAILMMIALGVLTFIVIAVFGQQGMGFQIGSMLIGALFGGVFLSLYCASMYQAWREVFGGALPSVPGDQGQLEL